MQDNDSDFDGLTGQGQEAANNMAKIAETSAKIWQLFLDKPQNDKPGNSDPLNIAPVMAEMARAFQENPQEMADATLDLWQDQMALWQNTMAKMLGNEPELPTPDLPPEGRRFNHKDWSENAIFEHLKQSYLLTSGWMQDTVENIDGLDAPDRKKAAFYTRTFAESMNPANFFALNPEVLEATASSNGENLVRGLNMMLEDMERGKGELLIRQTDMDAFEVGRDMAITPGKIIWQNNVLQLIQYAPSTKTVYEKPLLFIPPWINKYYVLDLNPSRSLMKWLVGQGYTVFIVSWVNPDEAQKDETWDSYLQAVSDAMDVVLRETEQTQLHLGSYCIGGTLTGTLLAHLGKTGDKRVASATFFTALMDFVDAGELQVFVDDKTIAMVDEQMEKGFLPAQTMASAFNMLRSSDLIWGYIVNNYMLGKDPFPFDLLYWNSDSTAMPAKVHHFYLETFYTKNAFSQGDLSVKNTPILVSDINVPVYHVATKEDHIAPAASVYLGAKMMENADVRFVLAGSGHIAGVVNPEAAGKYQYWTAKDMAAETLPEWLESANETAGSWWPDWDKWLKKNSGKKTPQRKPGAVTGVIEDAPGSFVKKRFDS